MYPQDQTPSTQPQPNPQLYGPPMPPVIQTPSTEPQPESGPNRKLLLSIAGGTLALLIIVVVLIVLLGGSSKKKQSTTTSKNSQQTTVIGPASSLGLQQNVDAINQDLSSLDSSNDFSSTVLSDSALTGSN